MKSLILKDLYNIGHNAKSMVLLLVFLAVVYAVAGNPSVFLYMCCHLCCMMVTTTFSFDSVSQWEQYALIMPLSRKDLVVSKFVVLYIFSILGILAGMVLFLPTVLILRPSSLTSNFFLFFLGISLLGLSFCQIANGLSIPLLFRFGTEHTRILSVLSSSFLLALFIGTFALLPLLGVDVESTSVLFALACVSVPLMLVWNYGMYRISCHIFAAKDL